MLAKRQLNYYECFKTNSSESVLVLARSLKKAMALGWPVFMCFHVPLLD